VSIYFHKYRLLYENSPTVKALTFIAVVSVMIFWISSWSLFQDERFNIVYGKYEYVSKTEGRRASPSTYHVRNDNAQVVAMSYLALDCIHIFDLSRQFEMGYVELNGRNVIVACDQDGSKLNSYDGLAAVQRSLKRNKYLAKSALVIFLISTGWLSFFLLNKD